MLWKAVVVGSEGGSEGSGEGIVTAGCLGVWPQDTLPPPFQSKGGREEAGMGYGRKGKQRLRPAATGLLVGPTWSI